MKPNILAISHARRALAPQSRERARLRRYAAALGSYHIIVFVNKLDGYPAIQTDGPLHIYATNARTKVGMLVQAYRIGRSILRQHGADTFVVSSQDPFESSLVGRLLVWDSKHTHQVQIHGDVFNSHMSNTSLLQRMRTWYGAYVVRRTGCIRVVSERIKRSLVTLGVSESAVTVLPIQADLAAFLQIGANQRRNGKDQPVRFLYVGRLEAEKNLTLLLCAFAQLRQKNTQATLRVVGDGSEHDQLEVLARELHIEQVVTFVGWREDIPVELEVTDVLCLSSNHEGWAMVLQEAAAARVPAVTTDVGCAGEFIMDGQQGLVVPVGDVDGYAAALEKMLDPDTRQRLADAAYEAAVNSNLTESAYIDAWVAAHCG